MTNPYQSAANVEGSAPGANTLRTLLRGVAIASWLVSAAILLFTVLAILHPQGGHYFRTQTYSFLVFITCTLFLPALSFFFFGLACWLRSLRAAIWGLALVVPLILFVAMRLVS